MSTFVSVGNAKQPFTRLLEAVGRAAEHLPQPVVVQCGHTPFESAACEVVPFMDMERFAGEMAQAELLILHAGAGSVIHALKARKTPVIVPRLGSLGEHVNDHQLEFAQALAEAEKAVVVWDVADQLPAVERVRTMQRTAVHAAAAPRMVALIGEALKDCARTMGKRIPASAEEQ